MGLIQDFKEFYRIKHNNLFDTNYLYVAEMGTFNRTRINQEQTRTTFDTQMFRIVEELSQEEVVKYLKNVYGTWLSDLPDYQNGKYNSVRYFKVPNSKLILPALTIDQATKMSKNSSIQGLFHPVPLKSFPNIPDYISIDEIKELEEKIKTRNSQQMGR